MKKNLIIAIVILAILAAIVSLYEPAFQKVAVNVLIQKSGKYQSPSGERYVEIWNENETELKYEIYRPEKTGHFWERKKKIYHGVGHGNNFQEISDWFMCWDSQDRLWVYVPDHDCCMFYEETAA